MPRGWLESTLDPFLCPKLNQIMLYIEYDSHEHSHALDSRRGITQQQNQHAKTLSLVLKEGNGEDFLACKNKAYFNYALYTELWDAYIPGTVKQERNGLERLQGKFWNTAVFTQRHNTIRIVVRISSSTPYSPAFNSPVIDNKGEAKLYFHALKEKGFMLVAVISSH